MEVLQRNSIQTPAGEFVRVVPLKAHEVKCSGGVTLKAKKEKEEDKSRRPPKLPEKPKNN